MGRFSKISQEAFDEFQVDAGVLLKSFDPANPELIDINIICTTTGGINPTCVPTYSDFGEDVDNVAAGTKELMRLDGWETTLGFTALNTTPETIRMALGAADIDAASGKITPRRNLKDTDFSDIWWVGDRTDGGLVAIRLINALSSSGFSLQTTKNGKGQIAVTLSGHVSIKEQDVVPMEFYVHSGTPINWLKKAGYAYGNINDETGDVEESSRTYATGFIPVTPTSKVYLEGVYTDTLGTTLALYDKNFNLVAVDDVYGSDVDVELGRMIPEGGNPEEYDEVVVMFDLSSFVSAKFGEVTQEKMDTVAYFRINVLEFFENPAIFVK